MRIWQSRDLTLRFFAGREDSVLAVPASPPTQKSKASTPRAEPVPIGTPSARLRTRSLTPGFNDNIQSLALKSSPAFMPESVTRGTTSSLVSTNLSPEAGRQKPGEESARHTQRSQ